MYRVKVLRITFSDILAYFYAVDTFINHIKHYTGKSQVSRGDPADQGQTGEV